MNTISVNLTLSGELYEHLNSFVANVLKGNNNDFIVEAIEQKLKNEKDHLQEKLIHGYQATKEEDLALVREFEFANYEKLN
jgi:metal-responsive CopG/Arc/MetJ family transcriptional regulator